MHFITAQPESRPSATSDLPDACAHDTLPLHKKKAHRRAEPCRSSSVKTCAGTSAVSPSSSRGAANSGPALCRELQVGGGAEQTYLLVSQFQDRLDCHTVGVGGGVGGGSLTV